MATSTMIYAVVGLTLWAMLRTARKARTAMQARSDARLRRHLDWSRNRRRYARG